MLPRPPEAPELTVPFDAPHGPRSGDLIIHRSNDLHLTRPVHHSTILVTNGLRTLVDLAGVATPADLTVAVDAALAKGLATVAGLEAEIQRLARPGRPGVGALRRHLADRGFIDGPAPSVLEAHLHRLIRALGVAVPTVELRVGEHGQYRLDVAWREILYAIEVDGFGWHFSPEHQRHDLARRNQLQELGWTLRVYTWRDILDEPSRVGQEILATYRRLTSDNRR